MCRYPMKSRKYDFSKILIIGGIGSGKTTLARKLSKKLNIESHELDDIFYKRRDIHRRRDSKTRSKKLTSILRRRKWIIEGFYSQSWTHPIYKQADVIIILNIKPITSKYRLIKRFITRKFSFGNENRNSNFGIMIKLLKRVDEYPDKYFRMQKDTAEKFNENVLLFDGSGDVMEFLEGLE